ncbi:hypothetical protein EDM59_01520 [Brevibacillus nitrificans]|uniref:Uncharacterized protein n=1 Tax=Brevibacillus nitrificans TaxID=651560 RepID=A0A3M8DPV0_9BACL|nr:hypothetical protein [Brevibacillus nitrificans]RNB90153.1 hypothetical protein EDM59_01520 [Brevibacillus nitrificans]
MAEYYRFFDSTDEDQREYRASEFAEYFNLFLTSGVFHTDDRLRVFGTGTNMQVLVEEGYAFLLGYMYKIANGAKCLTIANADPTNDRIDRVVVRLDFNERVITAEVKQGVPAAVPVPPGLTRTQTVHEISLAQVRVIAGKSFIEQSQVTDERLNQSVCGLVSSLITIPTDDMWQDWVAMKDLINADWLSWYSQAKAKYSEVAYQDSKKIAFYFGG